MKKLEIEKTKTTLIVSVLKVEYLLGGLSFFNFQLFLLIKLLWQINGWVLAAGKCSDITIKKFLQKCQTGVLR